MYIFVGIAIDSVVSRGVVEYYYLANAAATSNYSYYYL